MPQQDARDDQHAGLSWQDVAWLMLSDIVGTSVLTFAGVANELGWLLTVVFIVGLFPVSLFVSVLMARTRHLVLRTAALRKGSDVEVPVSTMGEIAGCTFKARGAGRAVEIAVYGYTFLGQSSYLLVLGTTIQMAFYDLPLCLPTAVALGCLFMAVPFLFLRQLRDSVAVCLVNTLLIAVVVVGSLIQIAGRSTEETRGIPVVNPELTFFSAFGAATNVVYSYAGQWMYFELMETMEHPSEFPRAFIVAGPFMLVTYLIVALLGSGLGATHGDLVNDVPEGSWLRAISAMLFVHVAIVYLIKGVVIARFLLKACAPRELELRTPASYLKHGGWAMSMLFSGWVLANAVPFFSQFLGLIGGLFAGPINFMLPILLFLLALGDNLRWESRSDTEVELPSLPGSGSSTAEETRTDEEDTEESSSDCDESSGKEMRSHPSTPKMGRLCASALRALPAWEVLFIGCIVAIITMTMVFGVYSQVLAIVRMSGKYGAPFTCHPMEHINAVRRVQR